MSISRRTFAAVVVCLVLCLSMQVFIIAPFSSDFHIFYRAAEALRSGANPYTVTGFYSPLYLLVFYLPFTLLPELLAIRLNSVITIIILWLCFWRFSRRSLLLTTLAMLSGCVFLSVVNGNNDFMPLAAGLVNPVAGVWLAMTKPQMGIVLVAVLILHRPRSPWLWLSLIAIALIYALSWLAGMRLGDASGQVWNRSVFPMMIPLGILAAQWALRKRDHALGMAASPLFAPYVGSQSWLIVLPWLMRYRLSYFAAIFVSWWVIVP